MPSKRYNTEGIIHKLREADVLLSQGSIDLARIFWSSFKVINKLNTGEPNHAFETI